MGRDYTFIPQIRVVKDKFINIDIATLPNIRTLMLYDHDGFDHRIYKAKMRAGNFQDMFDGFRNSWFLEGINKILKEDWPFNVEWLDVVYYPNEQEKLNTYHPNTIYLRRELDHIYGHCYLNEIFDYDWDSIFCSDRPDKDPDRDVMQLWKFFKGYNPKDIRFLIYYND